MKRIALIIMAAALVFGPATAMPEQNAEVVLDGQRIVFPDQRPIIIQDRTLVPLRGVFEAAGAKVSWDGDSEIATVIFNEIELQLQIGQLIFFRKNPDTGEFGGHNLPSGVAPAIINNRTLIPLRDVSELLGFTVEWDDDTKTAIITTSAQISARTIVIGR